MTKLFNNFNNINNNVFDNDEELIYFKTIPNDIFLKEVLRFETKDFSTDWKFFLPQCQAKILLIDQYFRINILNFPWLIECTCYINKHTELSH